jgi:thioredoxin-like negative regulator of GroEL
VLEEIMEAGPRTEAVQDLLSRLSRAIGGADYQDARTLLAELVTQVGEDDPEVTRAKTLLEFMEGKD